MQGLAVSLEGGRDGLKKEYFIYPVNRLNINYVYREFDLLL